MLSMRMGLRPYLSASMPKKNAPMKRIAKVRNSAFETAGTSVWNSLAISVSRNVSRKKSKASSVHPRNEARTVFFCSAVRFKASSFVSPKGTICRPIGKREQHSAGLRKAKRSLFRKLEVEDHQPVGAAFQCG